MVIPSSRQRAIADSELRKKIVVGVTTKGEVRVLLGAPWDLVMDEGEENWSYAYNTAGVKVLGIGSRAKAIWLTIRFTKSGVVKEKGYGGGEIRCFATTKTKQFLDNDIVSSIKPGKTTRTEIEALIGKPPWVSTYEVLAGPEEEEWAYTATREEISGRIHVLLVFGPPIARIVAAAADRATSSGDEFHTLSIRFSKEGIVKQVEKWKKTGHGNKQKHEKYYLDPAR